MELTSLLSAPLASIASMIGFIVPFLVVMTFIVFFHELGHFLVARWCGVRVETFSIGFGRELWGRNDRHGTRWKIAWIPLGGYVKFEGDENAASMPDAEAMQNGSPTSFHAKKLWQRALVVAAGPVTNFILAIIIFAAMFLVIGVPVSEPVVDTVQESSAAAEAGFKVGDRIVSVDGREIESFTDLKRIVSTSAGRTLTFVIKREGKEVTLTATPKVREVPDGLGGKIRIGMLGVSHNVAKDFRYERKGPVEAVALGARETWFIVTSTMNYLKGLILGRESVDQLAGPIRIAQASSMAASISLAALFHLAAVLSVSIGLINLFPIPMLDGGHLLYYLIEAIRGKPLGQSAQEFGFKVGFMLVLMLMLVATFNDFVRLFTS